MNEIDKKIIQKVFKKNKIKADKIIRFASGQINRVYDIDNKFVIKIEGDFEFAKDLIKHQPEIIRKLQAGGASVPNLIDHGNIEGKNYLLMNRIDGDGLANVWYGLDKSQKENFMSQIVEQLKIFHSIEFENFTISGEVDKKYQKWIAAVRDVSDFSRINKNLLEITAKDDVEYVENFYNNKVDILKNVKESVLVHQDIHFENIFYKDNNITGIIDFDWSCQAPREYDLWIIADYFHAPWYYVEERLEKYYQNKMMEEMKMLRKYYPELFEVENLLDKIRLYYISNLIDSVENYQKGRWTKSVLDKVHVKVNDFYKSSWLEEFLFG